MGVMFTGSPAYVNRVIFGHRPPSNSRTGQGDHIVAYTLIQHAISAKVAGKTIDEAAAGLEELIEHSSSFVKRAPTNNWWHTNATNMIARLQAIDSSNEAVAKMQLNAAVNNTAILINLMPGATKKNKKSTKGHGEDVTGLIKADRKRARGRDFDGNPWVNILKLIDLDADPSLKKSPAKLEQKVFWLMTLVTHTLPTLYPELEANYKANDSDPELTAATHSAYGLMLGLQVAGYIEDFMSQ